MWSSRLSLYPAGLLLYWIVLNISTNREESGKRDGREREREREEADELGLMELKASV